MTPPEVTQAWTGFQVAWTMARGYPGAFGRRVNALVRVDPAVPAVRRAVPPWRRRRVRRGGWSLLHLDLLVLLGFSVSLALFNHAQIGLSVPLVYPFLLYLLVRMLLLAFGRGRPREPLPLLGPGPWLAVGVVFLVGFRIGLNVTNSNVIDVGYAGVIGATSCCTARTLYGHWPADNASGDTYGPVNYYAYVPSGASSAGAGVGQASGRARRGDRLRPADPARAVPARAPDPRADARDRARLRVGGVSVHAVVAQLQHQRHAGGAAPRGSRCWSLTSAPARGVAARARRPDQVRAAGAGAAVPARPDGRARAKARSAATSPHSQLTHRGRVAPCPARPRLHAFWHDTIAYQAARVSPVLDLGPVGGLGFEQHLVAGSRCGARARGRVRAPPARPASGGRARRRGRHRAPDRRHLLVLPLYCVVLPAGLSRCSASYPTEVARAPSRRATGVRAVAVGAVTP